VTNGAYFLFSELRPNTFLDPYGKFVLTMNEIELGSQVSKFVYKKWRIVGFSKTTFSF